MRTDGVDAILEQWHRARPELDVSPMGIFGRVARLARLQRAASEARFRPTGLDARQFDVLATLRRSGGDHALSPSRLADAVMVTTGGMTGQVDRLVAAGLVSREPDPEDRRSVRVRLTPAGLAAVDEAVVAHMAAEEDLLAPLSAAERRRLESLLRKLLAARSG